MQAAVLFRVGAWLAGLAVAIGAFGAHALRDFLIATGREETFETAVRYQMYHALALVGLSLAARHLPAKTVAWVGRLFVVGTGIFSGTLYLLCLLQLPWMGAITPLGGTCLIAGWALLALARWQPTA